MKDFTKKFSFDIHDCRAIVAFLLHVYASFQARYTHLLVLLAQSRNSHV